MILRRLAAQAEEIVAGAAMVVVVLAVCWGVITRYVTAQPAAWTGEVAAIGFAWCVFVGAAAVAKRSGHVAIDMLTAALPAAVQATINAGARLASIGFCAVASVLAFEFSLANTDNPSAVLRLPLAVLYLAPATGFALMAVRMAERMLREPRMR
ncbi:TRAP transporter small permease [Elioraea rosea]|uniref:TRAP transporter small permease n=1 Tax=Elioraea rosea TaxID=2492390 RepID=UPI001183798E|nr:TRAP transporter small permease [Elioraea rosea]